MATVHWSGGDGDWSVAANWLEGAVPQPGDTVVIDSGNPHVTTNVGAMGSITVGTAGALTVQTSGFFSGPLVNHGHIDLLAGQPSVTGSYVNDGTIDIHPGAGLFFGAIALTPTDLSDGITNAGRVIVGTNAHLDLGGGTFDLAAYGRLELSFGTIANGTIVDDGTNPPLQRGTFDAIVYQGDLDIGDVTVVNGLTVLNAAGGAPGTLNIGFALTFSGAGTIDNVIINWTANDATGGGQMTAATGTTILGPNVMMNATVRVTTNGSFINQGQIDVTGPRGRLQVGGSLENEGEIAVAAGANFTDTDLANNGTVEVYGTAVLSGTLTGDGVIALRDGATVTLNGATGASQTITLVDGELRLANAAAFDGTIADFNGADDAIDLLNITAVTVLLTAGNVLAITTAAGELINLRLDPDEDFSGKTFQLTQDGTGTEITVACFLAGTGVATPEGERGVETLAIGDRVLTVDGRSRPVRWIGRQAVAAPFTDALRHHPVRIAAGALAEGVPVRDLHVSPEHALLIDGLLVEAGALVNGASVVRTNPVGAFVYFHVELDDHALIVAEGTAAETFVDNVTRRRFDNYPEYEALFGESRARIPELELPRVKSARQLPGAVRARLAHRAVMLGFVADAA
ncbi:Hint domain-containing protein [Chelatococcus reniformis]|uniref:Hedgehog/Intein (Hint) domain-containing protein n=1 Tax=Chelatococcus reniformis TaxID=1494448 RepID=A0A916U6W4_9HYPH|nr:Hint domain-containing protein [Chelatococcus reniformis]GGC60876.1 hypothetical protein GCM10010994_19380 [Chelatococcus reniformis]